jgi:hypothetical protein
LVPEQHGDLRLLGVLTAVSNTALRPDTVLVLSTVASLAAAAHRRW